jgi:choice-of-anchor C domain-containing protein
MMIRFASVAFPLLVVVPGALASCGNLISNGSFETGTMSGQITGLVAGDTNMAPWTIGPKGVHWIDTYWQASDGSRSVDLARLDPGYISQDISTVPGTSYTLLFDLSGNPDGGPDVKQMSVGATGNPSQTYTYDESVQGTTRANMNYLRDLTYTFTATAATTTITVNSVSGSGFGAVVDNFRTYDSSCIGGGGGEGDPHFQTFSGNWYDFHGICDLVLVSAPEFANGLGLDVHTRTKPRYEYSYIEAAAIKIGEDVLEVGSFGDYLINGVRDATTPYQLAGGKYTFDHEVVDEKKHRFSIKDDKEKEVIFVATFKDMVRVNVVNTHPVDFANVQGLLGNRAGLMLARDGATIIENPDLFGQEWQVTAQDGELFVTPSPYKDHCYPPSAVSKETRRLGENVISEEAAAVVCAYHEDPVMRDMCIFDVIAMGDLEVAGEDIAGAF